jgi:hypothetical protein
MRLSRAVDVSVFCSLGQVFSSVLLSSPTTVPSAVPSLDKENLAQFDKVMCCCCGTKVSASFCDAGLHGSASICPKVKFDWNDDTPFGHLTPFEHVIPPPSALH